MKKLLKNICFGEIFEFKGSKYIRVKDIYTLTFGVIKKMTCVNLNNGEPIIFTDLSIEVECKDPIMTGIDTKSS